MKATVPAKVSKRKARDERLNDFEALARFANLGDKPDDWANFRRMCQEFFPAGMEKWIYINAEKWWELSHLPDPEKKRRNLRPPLLYYRNLLRRVWRREDPNGSSLSVLLGFDAAWAAVLEEAEIEKEEPLRIKEEDGTIFEVEAPVDYGRLLMWKAPKMPEVHTEDGIRWMDEQTTTSCGLPLGTPMVDGKTSTIVWKFGCQFQTAIYYLMQERWRARVCPWCSKYFVADKATRKYCSVECPEVRKRKQARGYYHRVGKAKRRESKAKRTGAQRTKS